MLLRCMEDGCDGSEDGPGDLECNASVLVLDDFDLYVRRIPITMPDFLAVYWRGCMNTELGVWPTALGLTVPGTLLADKYTNQTRLSLVKLSRCVGYRAQSFSSQNVIESLTIISKRSSGPRPQPAYVRSHEPPLASSGRQ